MGSGLLPSTAAARVESTKGKEDMLKTFAPEKTERVDHRGRFVEIISEGSWQSIIHGEMNEGSVLGNQYHSVTRIYIYVIYGCAEVDFVDVGNGQKHRVGLTNGKGTYIEPGTICVMKVPFLTHMVPT